MHNNAIQFGSDHEGVSVLSPGFGINCWQNQETRQSHPHGLTHMFLFTPQPSGLEGYCRHGPGGRAGGCQTCGTHISVTAWWIFSIRSSVELSRPVGVHRHGHMPICPIWACPWAKNLSNLPQIRSRLCGTHISETAGWIYPIQSFMDLSGPVVVQRPSYLPICPI